MKPYTDKAACCGCAACADACPTGAISMNPDKEGFLYPAIRAGDCIRCGRCETVCPLRHPAAASSEPAFFGAQAKEEDLRRASSSGGMFPVLAEYIFRRQGVVFGAAFTDSLEVVHQEAWNQKALEGLKRTKYVQSRLDGVYRRIGHLLNEGHWVLFCGTPCQVHGLKRFLGKPHDRLILVDLICYGVPSPGLWRKYTTQLARRHGGPLTGFSFRDKRNRDNGQTRSFIAGGQDFAAPLGQDPYCGFFFANLSIRPSCHTCPYAATVRESDFTLGDFWGLSKVRPQAEDGMGTSLVLLHSPKALDIWEEVKTSLRYFPCRREEALQPRLLGPTPASRFRGVFMALYRVLPLSALLFLFQTARSATRWLGRLKRGT
ncbi:MAG: 4Fe-4S dicluster domain-containing protein [Oscillibacter sp.]|nr:4Fe-4S dicluster domain-containing protein [Oscillibacter sp.]